MKTLGAILVGLGRAATSPRLVGLIWGFLALFALPGVIAMQSSIRADIESSLIQTELQAEMDLGWLEEFHDRRGQLEQTLTPVRLSGFAALANLDAWFSGEWFTANRGLAAWGLLFILLWILIQGGVLDTLHRPASRLDLKAFGANSATYFFRFLRLAGVAGLGYYGVYRLAQWLFPAIERWTVDVTVEKIAMIWHLSGAITVVLLLGIIHLVADFAKIAIVTEQRRSAMLAIWRAARSLLTHPIQALVLATSFATLLFTLQAIYSWLAPSPAVQGMGGLVLAFVIGQIYLYLRWGLRVALIASELQLFDAWTRGSQRAVDSPR